jgi:hypothetical protein
MFKYLLYRAIRTGIILFNNGEAPGLEQCKREINDYNGKAEILWKSSRKFSERRKTCESLLGMTVPSLRYVKVNVHENDIRRFPASIEKELNDIFDRHYDTREKCLLFGRTDDEAYKVQDGYALAVAGLLEKVDVRYASRVHVCLRKIYGRGAPLPLLCSSSVKAMWEVCKGMYYKRQISLVSVMGLMYQRSC